MHQKIRAFSTKMAKNFSPFCQVLEKSNLGGHWVKVGKNGGLSVKASKKSRVFLVARNPKLSAPGVFSYFFPTFCD